MDYPVKRLALKRRLHAHAGAFVLQGMGTVLQLWPTRNIVFGDQLRDGRRLASDWAVVGSEIRKAAVTTRRSSGE